MDGVLDISDPVLILDVLFVSGGAVPCEDACDGDDDGALSLVDAIGLLAYLYTGGFPPPLPFQVCGSDPTPDAVTCDDFTGCP